MLDAAFFNFGNGLCAKDLSLANNSNAITNVLYNVDDVAWYSENSGGKSHDVATKKPNKIGLYDMSGNSWEWVYDWLVGYTAGEKVNPVQLTGSGNKTRRGGSYGEPAEFQKTAAFRGLSGQMEG